MKDTRNIVVLGASYAGIQTTHYIAKHILPLLRTTHPSTHYHLYIISPSSDFFFRVASPRVAASADLLPAERVFAPLAEAFKGYAKEDFTWIQGAATDLDITSRTVKYERKGAKDGETLTYHALVVATGSRTYHPAFSTWSDKEETLAAIQSTNTQAKAAKSIIVVGGGATGVEAAGELGDYLNGRPGWFSSPQRKVQITLLTSAENLLPSVRPAIGAQAEHKLNALGVDVQYNTRVADTHKEQDGRTTVVLANGQRMTADLYIPAYGVLPNSSWIPLDLLDDRKYIKTNAQTLRVDGAGPRVYAVGDISSASRNTILDIIDGLPVVVTNLKRDLLAYNASQPEHAAPGRDRVFVPNMKEMMVVPIGTKGGVGAIMGWRVPSWVAWLIKGRDYLLGMSFAKTTSGASVAKEIRWTKEEVVNGPSAF
ncbi:hypothetical protein N0V90_007737 [Kalmusia sp. IMI 367209]|nr:hypothetical protein N0V90_007737 [Kalmusia sp. IMI 367209]